MKADFNKIERDILLGLSDFVPRNQNQITDLIGNHENSTDRVHVSRSIKKLKPHLAQCINGFDEAGKRWVLKEDLETIRQIVVKYPLLLPQFQKNDKLLSMLVEKQFWMIDFKPFVAEYKKDEEMCKKCLEHLHEPPLCAVTDQQRQRCLERSNLPPPVDDLGKEGMEFFSGSSSNEAQNEFELEFKNRLKKSPYFLKTCLVNKEEELKEKMNRVYSHGLTPEANPKKRPFEKLIIGWEIGEFLIAYFNKIFEICVFHDILEGENTEKAEISENNAFRGATA